MTAALPPITYKILLLTKNRSLLLKSKGLSKRTDKYYLWYDANSVEVPLISTNTLTAPSYKNMYKYLHMYK
jgi:hypothetical protein